MSLSKKCWIKYEISIFLHLERGNGIFLRRPYIHIIIQPLFDLRTTKLVKFTSFVVLKSNNGWMIMYKRDLSVFRLSLVNIFSWSLLMLFWRIHLKNTKFAPRGPTLYSLWLGNMFKWLEFQWNAGNHAVESYWGVWIGFE